FFFQAEDGIRDFHVTGVQTCALPISRISEGGQRYYNDANIITVQKIVTFKYLDYSLEEIKELLQKDDSLLQSLEHQKLQLLKKRSEERRVGKECRYWREG